MTAEPFVLSAWARPHTGTGAARSVRREGRVPAILYGGADNVALSVDAHTLALYTKRTPLTTHVVMLDLEGQQIPALPYAVQYHPVSDAIEHLDFLRVTESSEIHVDVPVRILNQDKCPGIKRGGVLSLVTRRIKLACHPRHIPEHIDADIAALAIGDNIHLLDLALPSGVRLLHPEKNIAILAVTGRSADEKEETAAAAAS